MNLIAVLISVFLIQPQDTIPPVQPDTLSRSMPDTVQQVQPAFPDTLNAAFPDTLNPAFADTLNADSEPEEEPLEPIIFWTYTSPPAFRTAETDSTIRWINMVNFFERYHDEKGVITYRMGTTGRLDALELHAFETRHMQLEMEGLRLNDPLTGNMNWNRLPTQKIYMFREDAYGTAYRSRVRLKDYYLTKPRTYLNFDESKYNYRNLDFVFTQNVRQHTNLELSFWDRRDGIGYPRSDLEGRQAAALLYHQINPLWMVKAGYLNNAIDRRESFGYSVSDPAFFAFNRFTETPNQPGAESNSTSSDIWLQVHHRGRPDEEVSTELGLHYQTDKWSLSYTADTVSTVFNRAEIYARKQLRTGDFQLEGTGRAYYLFETEKQNLSDSSWLGWRFDMDASQRIFSRLALYLNGSLETLGEAGNTGELSGRLTLTPFRGTELSVYGGLLSKAPDLQALYWQADDFSGNSGLNDEESISIGGELKTGLLGRFSFGLRGDWRETNSAVFVDPSGQFVNADLYRMLSATVWAGLNTRIFEGEVSATLKQYLSDSQSPVNTLIGSAGERSLLKGHLYWKNYVFNRAAFVTAGISGLFSPNAYRTAEYLVPLNRWQHATHINRFQGGGTNTFFNPSYYRADLDVSARIRWFMLLLKWENIFDRMNQAGYFETTGYPMPERRFMLGLRILFTN
ncbi:hypothetical protein [Rhodohalobacter mucosus]|uniref:Porin n=1 Tax=Rhodohalobacter mucosus TaxID=2079485 RepID=A0A316TLK7_9BACT|nr:hypothetical protein [Rhodohalobacter mucosus]PWN05270.1 hypothetical protein DDZ15_14425 [Rhodohalobacter mucosus]